MTGEPTKIWTNLQNPLECPYCSTPLTAHSDASAGQNPPETGDFAVCLHCYGVAVHARTPLGVRYLRSPTAAEVTDLNAVFPQHRAVAEDRYTALRNAGLIRRQPGDRHP